MDILFDILFTFPILISGFFIPSVINNKLSKIDIRMLNLLWLFHICTGLSFYFYTRNGGGDAWGYWLVPRRMMQPDFIGSFFGAQGTEFMNSFNSIFSNSIGMGFFANTLLYCLFGFIGFIFLYIICIQAIPYNSKFYKYRLFPFLLFLPSLNFWSSGVGKDTLTFLCISMVAYGFTHLAKRFPLVLIALLLSYKIRPHITLMMVVAFCFAYIINSKNKISLPQRIFLFILLSAFIALILPVTLEFVKMDNLSTEELNSFSQRTAINLEHRAGSFVDIASYPYPLKLLTFIYRPFFFDINGIPAVIASFENLLLLLLSVKVIRSRLFITFTAAPLVLQGLFLFFIIGASVFCMSMSNLGIILRQRNMFLPGLVLFILWSLSYKQELALKKKSANPSETQRCSLDAVPGMKL